MSLTPTPVAGGGNLPSNYYFALKNDPGLNQTLSLSGNTLSISGGNSVNIADSTTVSTSAVKLTAQSYVAGFNATNFTSKVISEGVIQSSPPLGNGSAVLNGGLAEVTIGANIGNPKVLFQKAPAPNAAIDYDGTNINMSSLHVSTCIADTALLSTVQLGYEVLDSLGNPGSAGQVLQSSGAGLPPVWGAGGGGGGITAVQGGSNINVDATNPIAPIVNLDITTNLDVQNHYINNCAGIQNTGAGANQIINVVNDGASFGQVQMTSNTVNTEVSDGVNGSQLNVVPNNIQLVSDTIQLTPGSGIVKSGGVFEMAGTTPSIKYNVANLVVPFTNLQPLFANFWACDVGSTAGFYNGQPLVLSNCSDPALNGNVNVGNVASPTQLWLTSPTGFPPYGGTPITGDINATSQNILAGGQSDSWTLANGTIQTSAGNMTLKAQDSSQYSAGVLTQNGQLRLGDYSSGKGELQLLNNNFSPMLRLGEDGNFPNSQYVQIENQIPSKSLTVRSQTSDGYCRMAMDASAKTVNIGVNNAFQSVSAVANLPNDTFTVYNTGGITAEFNTSSITQTATEIINLNAGNCSVQLSTLYTTPTVTLITSNVPVAQAYQAGSNSYMLVGGNGGYGAITAADPVYQYSSQLRHDSLSFSAQSGFPSQITTSDDMVISGLSNITLRATGALPGLTQTANETRIVGDSSSAYDSVLQFYDNNGGANFNLIGNTNNYSLKMENSPVSTDYITKQLATTTGNPTGLVVKSQAGYIKFNNSSDVEKAKINYVELNNKLNLECLGTGGEVAIVAGTDGITLNSGGDLILSGAALQSATAGGSSGQHLKIKLNGVFYKIALLNN